MVKVLGGLIIITKEKMFVHDFQRILYDQLQYTHPIIHLNIFGFHRYIINTNVHTVGTHVHTLKHSLHILLCFADQLSRKAREY